MLKIVLKSGQRLASRLVSLSTQSHRAQRACRQVHSSSPFICKACST